MAPRLVNSAPGVVMDPVRPGQALYLGLRSETGSVQMGSLRSVIGFSNLANHGVLPEADPSLGYLGAEVLLTASERRRPITGDSTRTIVGGRLLITKTSASLGEASVYETRVQALEDSSVMGYFRIRKKDAWTRTNNPDWCNLPDMTGVYLGLEHGLFNNAFYAFLKGPPLGPGFLVVGGPLLGYNTTRPAQASIPFNWTGLLNDQTIEIWIFYNQAGYPSPFVPTKIPLIEVWGRLNGVGAPVILTRIPAQSVATFPDVSSNLYNFREESSNTAALFFGNLGGTGDVLELEDWVLYPDHRVGVSEGEGIQNHDLQTSPDGPVTYRSANAALPEAAEPARWFPIGGIPPQSTLSIQPGRLKSPQFVEIPKVVDTLTGYERVEPRLEQLQDGAMVEAFMAARDLSLVSNDTGVFGSGISIEDGAASYKAIFLSSEDARTVGIQKLNPELSDLVPGYYVPNIGGAIRGVDWTSLKLVRLTVDRKRSKVFLTVDEEKILEVPIAGPYPGPITADGRFKFGHLVHSDSKGFFNVQFLNYLSRYKGWEKDDVLLPDDGLAPVPFVEDLDGDAENSIDPGGPLVINKRSFHLIGSRCFYKRAEDLGDTKGTLVDFRTKVVDYTDAIGQHFAPNTSLGVGVQLLLGNKRMRLLFLDCGTRGRYVGIVPGSGSVEDLIQQNAKGRSFSAAVDWTRPTFYRVVYRAFQSIEVWIGTVTGQPSIRIPWRSDTQGFDLPDDFSSPEIGFGHFEEFPSSKTEWDYFRWGQSNGYDVTVKQNYPSGFAPYLFGGRASILSEFDG